jgi:hypothetical protein
MAVKKVSSTEARQHKGTTDWKTVAELTDEEIEKAAKEDPDSALPTPEQLKQFKRQPHKKDNQEK